jgi:hypothetical protein
MIHLPLAEPRSWQSLSFARGPALIVVLFLAFACRSQEQADADSAPGLRSDTTLNPPASPKSKPYSLAQFRQLRWLEGRWRGGLPDGGSFYEQYRWLDDSTIAMHGFADSTFTRATDSARISLRYGVIANDGAAARWVAQGLDSSSVHFVPMRGASNSFRWVRESPTRWTATLQSPAREGRAQSTVYRMQRIPE